MLSCSCINQPAYPCMQEPTINSIFRRRSTPEYARHDLEVASAGPPLDPSERRSRCHGEDIPEIIQTWSIIACKWDILVRVRYGVPLG